MLGIRYGTLAVSGATLYYEVRGSGPLLLMIHGGGETQINSNLSQIILLTGTQLLLTIAVDIPAVVSSIKLRITV